jgi:kumamolisin
MQTKTRVIAVLLGFAGLASAQSVTSPVSIRIPESSLALPGDAGQRSHTNIRVLVPANSRAWSSSQSTSAAGSPPFSGYLYQTPASIACIYGFVPALSGCNPNTVTANPTGGSQAIAIVDAFDDPTAASDLAAFSTQFGLPAPDFSVVYASGTQPPQDPTGGWELEESLDIEWAHAMAPNAKIYLVEAASNFNNNLFPAVAVASMLVEAAGGGEVSMSWASAEFPAETLNDTYFRFPGVVYFASAGDAAGVSYPSASPFVVSAGGTTLSMNLSTGGFRQSLAWEDTGGGPSLYEPEPSYQSGIPSLNGARGTPDIAFDADPNTGVWVMDSIPNEGEGGPNSPWWIVGGTSVAAPSLAGVVNAAGHFYNSTSTELSVIYGFSGLGTFKDVTAGICGPYAGYLASPGYDFCTGEGSPNGYSGK